MFINLNSTRFPQAVYTKSGKGFPLVLIHGFGEDHRIWQLVAPLLQQDFTLIMPDLPGSGNSALPPEPMQIRLLADFIAEILKQEQLEQVMIAGHSMGGYVALAFAEHYPQYLKAISMVQSGAHADDESKIETRRKAIRLLESGGKDAFIKAMIPNLWSEQSKQHHGEYLERHLDMAMQISTEALIAYYEAMISRPSQLDLLRTLSIPIQYILGTEDQALPLEQILPQCRIPSKIVTHILQGAGHTGMLEMPVQTATMINSFCKYCLNPEKP
jgi:pimeloyl-ACP methyl ester carboxylesterase